MPDPTVARTRPLVAGRATLGRVQLPDPVARALDHPVLDPGKEVVQELIDDRVSGLAAEIAFFSLLSVFPLLLLLASSLGALDGVVGADVSARAEDAIVEGLQTALGSDAEQVNDAVRQLFETPSPGLFSVGLVLSLWAASRAFAGTANALDVVYDLEEHRPWVKVRLLGLVLTVGTLVVVTLLLGLVLVGPLLGSGQELADRYELGSAFITAWRWLRVPFVIAALIAWATTLYHLAPHHHTTWRSDLPGALVAAVGWALVTAGFRVYVGLSSGNVLLGTIGGVLTAVLWLWAMAYVLLLGAQVNAVLGQRAGRLAAPHPDVSSGEREGVHPLDRLGRRLHGHDRTDDPVGEGGTAGPDAAEPRRSGAP